jgi:sulfur carrier protein ThiS
MPQISLTIRGRKKPVSRRFNSKSSVAESILKEMGINPLEVLIKLNGEFVPDNQRARKGDRIELLEITSRG